MSGLIFYKITLYKFLCLSSPSPHSQALLPFAKLLPRELSFPGPCPTFGRALLFCFKWNPHCMRSISWKPFSTNACQVPDC